jgi:LssY-like putative type I secretion system component LssY
MPPKRLGLRGLARQVRRWASRLGPFILLLLPAYALMAYVLLPASWNRCARRAIAAPAHPISYTAEGIPADPINVAVVGTRGELIEAMKAAGWALADPITVRSGLRDAQSVLFDRSYPSAPMSTHYLARRPQDLAFEQSAGRSPRRRHHVRLWRMSGPSRGQAVWLGAATYDRGLGVSRFTGEVMHHIDPNVDEERSKLVADLLATRRVDRLRILPGTQVTASLNGGGDFYRSDGKILVAVLGGKSVVGSQ